MSSVVLFSLCCRYTFIDFTASFKCEHFNSTYKCAHRPLSRHQMMTVSAYVHIIIHVSLNVHLHIQF